MQTLHHVSADCQRRDSSPDTNTPKTLVPLAGASACEITVETTNARVTFDTSTPTATNGHVLGAAANPIYLPFAPTITWISTAGTASVVNVTWLYT